MKEMLLMIKEQYDKIAIDHLIARRLVITGGGSMLRGIKELASKIFEKQVRIAKPSIIPGFAEDCNPGIYSTSLGMVKDFILKQQKQSFEIGLKEEDYGWVKKTLAWLKENI
jgi:cell division protein FtsA